MVLRWLMATWVRAALWFRLRRIGFVFHAPPPCDGPAILAANHQNALLDTMTLAALSPKGPYTLSRGSLFDNPAAGWFLRSLRFLPVYRFRDGFGKMRQNTEMFSRFVEVLQRNGWLLIFPEGSHFRRFTLRPLQKGLARIAFAAQEAWGWRKEVPVIPVGLQYESHTAFGSRLLIQFGRPLSSLAFRDLHSRDPKGAEKALTAELFKAMESLILLPPQEEATYREALRRWEGNLGRFRDLQEQFEADQELMTRLRLALSPGGLSEEDGHPASGGRSTGEEHSPLSGEAGGRQRPAVPATGQVVRRPWRRILGYALSLPGLILHLPALLGILAWERAFVRDWHLAPAARFAVGMFLVPLWYIVALGLWHPRAGSMTSDLILLTLMPLSLWLWSRHWHWTR